MASETVDPNDWSQPQSSWEVPPLTSRDSIKSVQPQRESNVQPQHARQPPCLCGLCISLFQMSGIWARWAEAGQDERLLHQMSGCRARWAFAEADERLQGQMSGYRARWAFPEAEELLQGQMSVCRARWAFAGPDERLQGQMSGCRGRWAVTGPDERLQGQMSGCRARSTSMLASVYLLLTVVHDVLCAHHTQHL